MNLHRLTPTTIQRSSSFAEPGFTRSSDYQDFPIRCFFLEKVYLRNGTQRHKTHNPENHGSENTKKVSPLKTCPDGTVRLCLMSHLSRPV